jgi:malate synthase
MSRLPDLATLRQVLAEARDQLDTINRHWQAGLIDADEVELRTLTIVTDTRMALYQAIPPLLVSEAPEPLR